ncbi:AfsR/SARP family transcriptional regulator [Plantactinospora sonchi]|uniref:BTAD domain-containing putative transcriptional regulator n=1 Tax=Plantactinospora sonchi TaxID=1544735 RepID=A0ABU7S2B7_9ACTN
MSVPLPAGDPVVGVLGPLEVTVDGNPVDLGGPRQQVVLAALALEANRPVPVSRLLDIVYGAAPPSTSRVQVQICVSALRRLFAEHGCGDDVIATRSQGYALQVPDTQVDLRRFGDLAAQGRRFRDERRLDRAVECYRRALAQWRGPALDGLVNPLLRPAADRLDEQRISLIEDCVELELELGRHHDLIAELTALVEEHPMRERLHGQLMLALYRSQRQAEALVVYRRARRALVDELGIEPGTELQRLEQDILTGNARLDPPEPAEPPRTGPAQPAATGPLLPVPAAPRLLPTDIADFTGRAEQAEAIERHLTGTREDRTRLAVPVLVASGMAGVGKTTLAVHVAHRLSDRYVDGQLFIDLRGQTTRPVDPNRVLERFLRVLGVPGTALPETLEERAEMYRHLVSGRRILVVLDNANDEGQVLPLLPGTPSAAVLVTSRSRLAGLPGTGHVEVGLLDPHHSVELLTSVAGPERMRTEPAAAAELAELCGHLPLALRVAGARLATRPQWAVSQLVERLGNETRRLNELNHGVLGIRASISLTYDSLPEQARRLFRRLALLDFPHFSGWVAAALLDQPGTAAQDVLDDIADAHLLETTGSARGVHSQYRFHDLIRAFARERLAAEEPVVDQGPALARALGALLCLADAAHRACYGVEHRDLRSDAPRWPVPERLAEELVSEPIAWLERERLSMLAAVRQAAGAGFTELSWDLAQQAVTLYEARGYFDDWRETHTIALDAARRAGDRHGQAVLSYSFGSLFDAQRRFSESRRFLDVALDLFGSTGNDAGRAHALQHMAIIDRLGGHLEDAMARCRQALAIFQRAGDLVYSAYVLHNLAAIELQAGNPNEAHRVLTEALDLSRRGGSRRIEAQVLYRLGETHLHLDEPLSAVDAYTAALAAVEDTADPIGRAFALCGLGTALLRAGKVDRSETTLREALRAAATVGDRLCEARALLGLGEFDLARDEPRAATAYLRRALELFRDIGTPPFVSRTLDLLARAERANLPPADA